MKNKLLYILIALFLLSSTATSQSIQYSYDNAGNRTSRLQTLTDFQSASGPLYRALSVAPFAANANNTIENLVYTSPTSYTLDSKLPVGSIPYTFNVNPNGSSAFSIPLSLPQGQAGLTPEISINYNSQAGEGILGYGMSLSCISSITRCGQRSFYDGANSAVSMTSALFELDGMRLIKNGSANNYLKEVDDFSRITQHNGSTGNPEYFLVKKKDGTKLYYGNYNGTNAFQKSSAKSATIAWYLAAQEDVHGNYISYQYEQDMTNGDVWLTSITYTLNANHNFQHENKILFSYQRYVEAPDGQLASEGVAGHQSVYTYTSTGLLQKEVKTIKDQTLTKSYTYDSKGRLLTYTSPSGLVQKSIYDVAHNLISITDNATSDKLWEARRYNRYGLLSIDVNCGNKRTTYTYDQMGRYTGISNSLAAFSYQYNRGGLLTQRTEKFSGSGLTETFAYDAGEALISATLAGKTPVTVAYNNGRAIKTKSDIGSYTYTTAGAPLSSVAPVSAYSATAQQLSYHKNNLPSSIAQGGYTRTYEYAANDQRDYSVLTTSSSGLPFAASKRYYFDDFERNINTENGAITDLDYIFANGRLVALVRTTGGSKTCYGVMTDRLGSLISLYTAEGIVQKFSYDAWGNRRNPLTGAPLSSAELVAANSITSRGYTGHEHIDEFGLINMNARIYDAKLGMFISVDPQADNYLETYPYAYCGGDPLNRVDLTGEDYWSTSDPETINSFWRWFNQNKGRGSYDFSSWYKMSDDEFRDAYNKYGEAALTYNDQTSTLYSSYGAVKNGEVVIYGVKIPTNIYRSDYPLGEASPDSYLITGEPPLLPGFSAFKWASLWKSVKGIFASKKGYESFIAFKKAYGPAGKGMAWHHIVEQNADNIARFGAERIHNTRNLIRLPHGKGSIHAKLSGYYSSKQNFTNGLTVREWLKTQNYAEQYKFGINELKKLGWKP